MSMAADIQAIKEWIAKNVQSDAKWPEPLSKSDIEFAEVELGNNFPNGLRGFYLINNGFIDWLSIYRTWEILDIDSMREIYFENLNLFGEGSLLENENKWQRNWLPFASDGAGDYIFVESDSGKVYSYSHVDGEVRHISNSLDSFINMASTEFQEGNYSIKSNGQIKYDGDTEF